jgi:hypothetical protein
MSYELDCGGLFVDDNDYSDVEHGMVRACGASSAS